MLTGYGAPLRLIARPQWLAQPPSHTLNPLELPSNRVIIAHTATEQCTTQVSCYNLKLFKHVYEFLLFYRQSVFFKCELSKRFIWIRWDGMTLATTF